MDHVARGVGRGTIHDNSSTRSGGKHQHMIWKPCTKAATDNIQTITCTAELHERSFTKQIAIQIWPMGHSLPALV